MSSKRIGFAASLAMLKDGIEFICTGRLHRNFFQFLLCLGLLFSLATPTTAAAVSSNGEFSGGISFRVEAPEPDVEKAVQDVTQDQIIHGTYSYEKEKILYGAHAAESSSAFREPPEPGKTFYKVAEKILAPRFFRESGDIGTITVRYIITPAGASASIVRIEAIFVDARRDVHASQGDVENAEFTAIKQRLEEIQGQRNSTENKVKEEARKQQQVEAEKMAISENAIRQAESSGNDTPETELALKVEDLRRKVERRVKSGGTPLKSAPFKSASTIQSLPAKAEVVVVVLTPYWYGVETEDGHRGWLHRSEVEPVP